MGECMSDWHEGLTRRLRSLLKTGPFHRLRAGEGRYQHLRPHDDTTALCIKALDVLVGVMGVSAGVSRADLCLALSPLLLAGDRHAGAAPDPERHREVVDL